MKVTFLEAIELPRTDEEGPFTSCLGCLFSIPTVVVSISFFLFIIVAAKFTELVEWVSHRFFKKIDSEVIINDDTANSEQEQSKSIFICLKEHTIYKKYLGTSGRGHGPLYYELFCLPPKSNFNGKIYGEWFFHINDGVFIQEWNSLKEPSTNLTFIDNKTAELSTLWSNIPSVLWEMKKQEDGSLLLSCQTRYTLLTYRIDI